jgi:hypothetical protein
MRLVPMQGNKVLNARMAELDDDALGVVAGACRGGGGSVGACSANAGIPLVVAYTNSSELSFKVNVALDIKRSNSFIVIRN